MGCSKHCFSWCRKVAVKMQGYKRPDDWACLCEYRVLKLESLSCWQITSLLYWGPSGLLSMDPTSAGVLRVSRRHCPHILPQGQHRYLSPTSDTPNLMKSDLQDLGHWWLVADLGGLSRMTWKKVFGYGAEEGHKQQSLLAAGRSVLEGVCEVSIWMRMPSIPRDCSQEP